MTKVIDPISPHGRGRLPEPDFTSLSHAVRWIAKSVPVQSLAFQEATGDRPDVSHIDYSTAKQQLLKALRDERVSAKAILCLRHKSVMYEVELDEWISYRKNGGAPWFLFLDALNESTGCLSAERYVSDVPISIPGMLWEDRFIRWDDGHLRAWLGEYDASLEQIQLSVKELYGVFTPATKQLHPDAPAPSTFNTKEKESLLKLVIGMAVAAYRYNPQAARSDIPTEIVNDLMRAGVPLDADTVRKFLRMGAKLLPPQVLDDRES